MDTLVSEEEVAAFREYMADPSARAAFVEFKAQAAANGTARRYEHVLRAVSSRPWAIHAPMLAVIVDVLTFRAYGGRLTAEEIEGRIGAVRRHPSGQAPQGVARIPISGVIMPKASAMSDISGGTSAESLGNSIRSAVRATDVSSIILDIDSPGGSVEGIPELAAIIAEANRIKPVVAVANHEANSAAYWLASQAGRIVASPSARLGSIGVITAHEDETGKNEKAGVQTTVVSAGKFKAEMSPFQPLTEEGRAHLQAMVDEFYGMFVQGVAEGRGVKVEDVTGGFGEGRVVTAKTALAAGMIDDIDTIDAVISQELHGAELSGNRPAATGARGHLRAVARPDGTAGLEIHPPTDDPAVVAAVEKGLLADPDTLKAGLEAAHDAAVATSGVVQEAEPEPLDEYQRKLTPAMAEIARLEQVLHSTPSEADTTDPRIIAAVDNSDWDGNKAMGQCSTAAEYRSICAGEHTAGTPDERQHWALPHHYLGKGPNAAGVRNALSRLPQTENLKNREAAQSHLDAHMAAINPGGDKARADGLDEDPEITALREELEVLSLTE